MALLFSSSGWAATYKTAPKEFSFFSSSLIKYFLFFHSPAWGVERDRIYEEDIKQIPIPNFTAEQILSLTLLQKELVSKETDPTLNANDLQEMLDERLEKILNIPNGILDTISAADAAKAAKASGKELLSPEINHKFT